MSRLLQKSVNPGKYFQNLSVLLFLFCNNSGEQMKRIYIRSFLFMLIMTGSFTQPILSQRLSLDAGGDIVSRYIWRGTDVNDQVNVQPYITFTYSDFELGAWGSYGLSHLNATDDQYGYQSEIDTWLSYSFVLTKGVNITAIFTDYFFPDNGKKFSNFNNYDNPDGPGAHTIESGLIIAGDKTFPLSFSGYVNIYNDKGNNAYFQADYLLRLDEFNADLFIGAAKGSSDNPAYYATNKFSVINTGIKVSKSVKITETYSLPVYCSYIVNPNSGLVFFVFGLSL